MKEISLPHSGRQTILYNPYSLYEWFNPQKSGDQVTVVKSLHLYSQSRSWPCPARFIRSRLQLKCDGTKWCMGGEVKGKLANGVSSQYPSHYLGEHGVSSITTADVHTSAASSWLNWRPCWFKWIRPFRWKTKSGFRTRAITFQLASTYWTVVWSGY